jgi:hypothetical protein
MMLCLQTGAKEECICRQSTGEGVENRSTVRYQLRVPVLFSWENAQTRPREAGGFTRDMSIAGAYIICDVATDRPPIHSSVAVRLLLPPLEEGAHSIPLSAEARVVRLGSKSEDSGFAIVADFGANVPDSGTLGSSSEER